MKAAVAFAAFVIGGAATTRGGVASSPGSDDELRIAFHRGADGYSLDEVLTRDDLRTRVLAQFSSLRWERIVQTVIGSRAGIAATERERTPPWAGRVDDATEVGLWRRLLTLRKQGRLSVPTWRTGLRIDAGVYPIAEMACRAVADRHRISSDEMLLNPRYVRELDHEARRIDAGVDVRAVRKAILSLRKRRRLRPELVLKVAHWSRDVRTYDLTELRRKLANASFEGQPGVYLFRSPSGYLYVGEAKDLQRRLQQHLRQSDRAALGRVLSDPGAAVTVEIHGFQAGGPGASVAIRRAYESELIRSRRPRFNVRP